MSGIKSLEKLRESSHLDDNKWTLASGDVVYMCNYEHGDPNAVNWGEQWRKIADEIEAEIAERYMPLPCDADGVPVCLDDKLECERTLFTVENLSYYGWGWRADGKGVDEDGVLCDCHFLASNCRHVERKLEDMLERYVIEYQTRKDRSEIGIERFDHVDVAEMIGRCADEIRAMFVEVDHGNA